MEDAVIDKKNSHVYALVNFHHPLSACRNMFLHTGFQKYPAFILEQYAVDNKATEDQC